MRHYQTTLICSLIIAAVSICKPHLATAQQFAYLSGFSDTRHIWNPACMASDDQAIASIYARQQWVGLGLNTAPRYFNATLQYPFEDFNMTGGITIHSGKAGPITNTGVVLKYAYQLKSVLSRYSKLSFGISASATSFRFDPSGETYRDAGDPLLIESRNSDFFPSLGGGFHFISNTRAFKGNAFFAGLSLFQALSTNILIDGNNFDKTNHIFAHIGTSLVFQNSKIEPSIHLNYTNPEFVDLILNAKYELEEAFWAGVGFSTVNDLFVQGGVIVPGFGSRYGELKLGFMANINVGQTIQRAGPGFEVFANYGFEN